MTYCDPAYIKMDFPQYSTSFKKASEIEANIPQYFERQGNSLSKAKPWYSQYFAFADSFLPSSISTNPFSDSRYLSNPFGLIPPVDMPKIGSKRNPIVLDDGDIDSMDVQSASRGSSLKTAPSSNDTDELASRPAKRRRKTKLSSIAKSDAEAARTSQLQPDPMATPAMNNNHLGDMAQADTSLLSNNFQKWTHFSSDILEPFFTVFDYNNNNDLEFLPQTHPPATESSRNDPTISGSLEKEAKDHTGTSEEDMASRYRNASDSFQSLQTPPNRGNGRRASSERSEPVPEELEIVKSYLNQLIAPEDSNAQLPKCKHLADIITEVLYAINTEGRKKTTTIYSQEGILPTAKCSACKKVVCLGCGNQLNKTKASNGINERHDCIHAHLLSVVLILSKIDALWVLKESTISSSKASPNSKISTPSRSTYGYQASPGGIGYGTGNVTSSKSKPAISAKQESEDKAIFVQLLKSLATLLSEDDAFSFSSMPANYIKILISCIKVSYLPELIRSLVRNDSIMDIDSGKGWSLYSACMELVRTFTDYDPLLELLVTALKEKKSSPGLSGLVVSSQSPPVTGFVKTRKRNSLSPVFEPIGFVLTRGLEGIAEPIDQSFEKLIKQCQAFMKNTAKIRSAENQDEETDRILAFCTDIDATAMQLNQRAEAFKKKMEASRPSRRTSAMSNAHLANLSPEILAHPLFANQRAAMAENLKNPLFVPSEVISECKNALKDHLKFAFSPNVAETHCSAAQDNSTGASNPGRMRRLVKELTVLSTTLPDGIFVRVQEDRPELFKVLIVGPDSTPYQYGLYEFDFTIPGTYPNKPPLVSFKTTGGGRVRFNPNLYNCGKVCLSILGTWSGSASEKWQPGKSTLLQILVSIQAMILCAEPFYNEPGYHYHQNNKESKIYNENVQLENMKVAMNGWLSYDGLWNNVVRNHFLARTAEILPLTTDFVSKCDRTGFSLSSYLPFMGGDPGAPPFDAQPGMTSTKGSMQQARDILETNLRAKLPEFLKAEPWKEKNEK